MCCVSASNRFEASVPGYHNAEVEGHKEKVFATLRHPTGQISFECTPEVRETARVVMRKLSGITAYPFLPLFNGELPCRPASLPLRPLEEMEALLAPESFYTSNYLDLFAMAVEYGLIASHGFWRPALSII